MDALKQTTKLISELCITGKDSGGRKFRTIRLSDIQAICAKTNLLQGEVEIACLERQVIPLRYLRNIGTVGIAGQIKLLRSSAAVCGAGGLGGTIIELLARQGVGRLVIIDNGRFVENNLNRQIIATESDLRRSKVKVAAERVRQINSSVKVTPVSRFLEASNVMKLITGADVVLDGLDSLATRLLVAGACNTLKIPFVHGAIAGFSGQLMTVCPGDKGLSAIYGPDMDKGTHGLETLTGNPPATPAIIAAWEVQEAVKIITGIGTPIRNRLLFLDFAEGSLEEIPLQQGPNGIS
ncbi:MAG: HesA/MoeB/ThiF family protein [Chloroflexi bacterium]|nr:HesA/MoeB/ThiF family protein [Chloroflexota bacterium]